MAFSFSHWINFFLVWMRGCLFYGSRLYGSQPKNLWSGLLAVTYQRLLYRVFTKEVISNIKRWSTPDLEIILPPRRADPSEHDVCTSVALVCREPERFVRIRVMPPSTFCLPALAAHVRSSADASSWWCWCCCWSPGLISRRRRAAAGAGRVFLGRSERNDLVLLVVVVRVTDRCEYNERMRVRDAQRHYKSKKKDYSIRFVGSTSDTKYLTFQCFFFFFLNRLSVLAEREWKTKKKTHDRLQLCCSIPPTSTS